MGAHLSSRAGRGIASAVLLAACGTHGIPDGPWLEDVTLRAGLAFDRVPPDGYATLVDRLGGGVCAIDADGRRPIDLFFAMRRDGSRLYVARAPLEYDDVTATSGLDRAGDAIGCLALDADDDGDDDLLVTGVGTLRLFENDGGTFRDASARLLASVPPTAVLTGAAAGDADGDGDLDLLVGGFVDVAAARTGDCDGLPCAVLVNEQPPLPNLLLLGGGGVFTDATALAPALAIPEPTLVVAIADLDSDRDADLYVGNDGGDLFRDRALAFDGARWVDESDRIGLAYDSRGHGIDTMGWTAGDVDGDLRLDFAITAFEGYPSPIFVCEAGFPCEDHGRDLGTTALADSFRWGNAFVDLDLDGELDLIEATGHVYTEEEGRAIGFAVEHAQRPNLLHGHDGRFDVVVPRADDALSRAWPARGIAITDLDDDGRPDVVLAAAYGPPAVLRNVRAPHGHWLEVSLRGRAVGARVIVRSGERTQLRARVIGEGFLGSFDPRLFFGVPEEAASLEVEWPSGARTTLGSVDLDREIEIDEP